jgi:hypothetical protein
MEKKTKAVTNLTHLQPTDTTENPDSNNEKIDDLQLRAFQDLSPLEQDSVIDEYYDGIPVEDITFKYKLNVARSALVKQFPPVVDENNVCPYCNKKLIAFRRSRAYPAITEADFLCPVCKHKPAALVCQCDRCKIERIRQVREAEQIKRQQIKDIYGSYPPVMLEKLDFELLILLGALCNYIMDKNGYLVPRLSEKRLNSFGPTKECLLDAIQKLWANHVIIVSSDSPMSAFGANFFPQKFSSYEVFYEVNVETFDPNDIRKILQKARPDAPKIEVALNSWFRIAKQECYEYANLMCINLHWMTIDQERTDDIFAYLLRDFSVAQIFQMIWWAASDTARTVCQKNLRAVHATNYFLLKIRYKADYVKGRKLVVSGFLRPYELPQSHLSSYLANSVLGVGDLAFTMNYYDLREKLREMFIENRAESDFENSSEELKNHVTDSAVDT